MTHSDLSAFKEVKENILRLDLKDEDMIFAHFFAAGIKHCMTSLLEERAREIRLND